jgi:hypothetical protein
MSVLINTDILWPVFYAIFMRIMLTILQPIPSLMLGLWILPLLLCSFIGIPLVVLFGIVGQMFAVFCSVAECHNLHHKRHHRSAPFAL